MADEESPKEEVKEEVKEIVETPPPPTPPAQDDDLRDVVTKLTETVTGIVERLEQINPVSHESDVAPVSKPWTHKGSWK